MITLLVIGLFLYYFGLLKTLALYVGVALTCMSIVLEMVCGFGFSYLFWSESMRTFEIGEFWTTMFTSRDGFELWEASVVPVIFMFDMVRVAIRIVLTRPTIFTIGFFGYWLYCMNMLWGMILPIFLPGNRKTAE